MSSIPIKTHHDGITNMDLTFSYIYVGDLLYVMTWSSCVYRYNSL